MSDQQPGFFGSGLKSNSAHKRVVYEQAFLNGTRNVPDRSFSALDVRKVVYLQACARRFLAQRLVKNMVSNPHLFMR